MAASFTEIPLILFTSWFETISPSLIMYIMFPPCTHALKYPLRQRDPPFSEYFYLAWQCSLCPVAPERQRWASAASRTHLSAGLCCPSLHLTAVWRQEWMVKQGFPQQPFPCKAGKESLAFSITLPIPFSRCLKAKYPPNSSLTSVSFGTQEKNLWRNLSFRTEQVEG